LNLCSASEFIRKLDKLHRDINHTSALIQEPLPGTMINMPRLRASMDICLEQLPTLLKIELGGTLPVTHLLPRVLSQLRALSVYSESGSSIGAEERISESMGYVLQKVQVENFFLVFRHLVARVEIWENGNGSNL